MSKTTTDPKKERKVVPNLARNLSAAIANGSIQQLQKELAPYYNEYPELVNVDRMDSVERHRLYTDLNKQQLDAKQKLGAIQKAANTIKNLPKKADTNSTNNSRTDSNTTTQ